METIPNHVMMMTGVRPDRSGVPANAVYDRAEGVVRDLDRPTDLRFPTLLERLNATGRTTGTVLSKRYLFGIFGERATYRWEPFPLLPVTEHAPDVATGDALVAMVDSFDPDLVFVNFGDTDRVGHSDLTGHDAAARPAGRRWRTPTCRSAASSPTCSRRGGGRAACSWCWPTTRWTGRCPAASSRSTRSSRRARTCARRSRSRRTAARTSCTGPVRPRRGTPALAEVRRLVAAHPGVLSVQAPADLRLGPEAGDLVAYCRAGWRFTDPTPVSNPIPGNHGHPVTEPIPFLVAGGHPAVRRGVVLSAPARTVDVAPTVGALFGLGAPRRRVRRHRPDRRLPPLTAGRDLHTRPFPGAEVGECADLVGQRRRADGGGEGAGGEPAVGQPEVDDVVEDPLVVRGGAEGGVHQARPAAEPGGDRRVRQVPAEPRLQRPPVGRPRRRALHRRRARRASRRAPRRRCPRRSAG